MQKLLIRSVLTACAAMHAGSALAHPHVFAEATLEVTSTTDGMVDELRHVWRFDHLFSSTVLLEFDADASNTLDDAELKEVAKTVSTSIAEFNYFQIIDVGGEEVTVSSVNDMVVDMVDDQLLILFTAKPSRPVAMKDSPVFSVYDPTFYTSIEYYEDTDMALIDPPDGCSRAIIVPDPDEAIAQNQSTLTEEFFNDPGGNDLSKIFATRMEVSCAAAG